MQADSQENIEPNNYTSTTTHSPRRVFETDRLVTEIKDYDKIRKFKLKLIKVNRAMNKRDEYYLHQQMKRYFPLLKDTTEPAPHIFNLLINNGYIGPENVEMLVESFFAMKRHELISILTDEEVPRIYREIEKSRSFDEFPAAPKIDNSISDQFVYKFCSEEIAPNNLLGLGVKGFKLPIAVIYRAQHDYKTTLEATISVFTTWKQEAPYCDVNLVPRDAMPPYNKGGLARALKDAELNFILQKYFK